MIKVGGVYTTHNAGHVGFPTDHEGLIVQVDRESVDYTGDRMYRVKFLSEGQGGIMNYFYPDELIPVEDAYAIL